MLFTHLSYAVYTAQFTTWWFLEEVLVKGYLKCQLLDKGYLAFFNPQFCNLAGVNQGR